MQQSLYQNQPQSQWLNITEQLVREYPLSKEEILEISLLVWKQIWTTKVGGILDINKINLPATVIGYMFQKLFTYELSKRYPQIWKDEVNKGDKDIVCVDNHFSTEMKASGQMGYKVFGNRSYCQKSDNPSKAKSGYYITINFVGQVLTLVRLGWIDKEDWRCQEAESGQASSLRQEVYDYKLIEINGEYQLNSPIGLLYGVGEKIELNLQSKGIFTFNDIKSYKGNDQQIINIRERNRDIFTTILNSITQ